ncbi:hypothetical protein [Streptomyces gobiensis]|uniref:hypothetical protein n=1 Tax=Streptomyces gobiensis TaxID=2875706 RepID=UPI001E2CE52A|nr:hypothetical protein [Streptomyces gobiensis]UGY94081.1 hypothetical protein test1122_21755 [Streptomyces gobiensis]
MVGWYPAANGGRLESRIYWPPSIPQERATSLDELVLTSADGEHLFLRIRSQNNRRRISYLWALASDVQRWHEITGETDSTPETGPTDEDTVTFTEEELDSSCRYGEEGSYSSDPRPQRDVTSATGLHTFDHLLGAPERMASRPVQIRLTENERRVIAAKLRCHPWEIGPCVLCATPIRRYGPRSPLVCPACRSA